MPMILLSLALSGARSWAQDAHAAGATLNPFPSTYQPLPRQDMLIENATILDGVGHRLNHASLLLRDGKISQVGEQIEAPAKVVTIDAKGRYVTPGLIDVHSHLGDFAAPLTLRRLQGFRRQ